MSVTSTNPDRAILRLTGVTKAYETIRGERVEALAPVDLTINAGEFAVIVGASGCGKTTLLNLVAGFEVPTEGTVSIDDRPITGPGRDRMMLFQEHALFPWLTVIENVMFGLRYDTPGSQADHRDQARRYLDLVGLGRFAAAHIHELSGGMRQRVALARALAPEPEIILFDEPFGALDALTRERFYTQIQALFALRRITGLFVTHNVREAACLGDRVLVMSNRPGRIMKDIPVPLPRPRDFYDPEVSKLAGHILHELRQGAVDEN
jgi:NitT/TauT family transport system ATP-binding protein